MWFETPATHWEGIWGAHWTMATRDPNVLGADGRRQIASHFYPLIGPYASRDPTAIEWQLRLMKTAGISGVLIDWYGVNTTNKDLLAIAESADVLVAAIASSGLEFAFVLEDRFATSVLEVRMNVRYLAATYFAHPSYARSSRTGEPYLLLFGPLTVLAPSAWTTVLEGIEPVSLITLDGKSAHVGSLADGEFGWPFADKNESERADHVAVVESFYLHAATLPHAIGVVYPGFDDFYHEGGTEAGLFHIPYANGTTLAVTTNLARRFSDRVDMVQVATWKWARLTDMKLPSLVDYLVLPPGAQQLLVPVPSCTRPNALCTPCVHLPILARELADLCALADLPTRVPVTTTRARWLSPRLSEATPRY